ncbi:MAG: manganese efflux pump [bacterium]|nr:manganese efflux pump [bacterium]
MNIILIFFIAISLSMDAFSLSLAYGTNNILKKDINLLSVIVGIYHFVMPILGMLIGKFIECIIHFKSDYITLVIFAFIGFNMIIESFKNETDVKSLKLSEMILFGFAVSIDSFSVGIGINSISNNFLICSLIFSFTSFTFTYVGLILGNKLNKLIGKFATLIGGISLIILGIFFAK